MSYQLSDLAERFGLTRKGLDKEITGVGALESAGPNELSFLADHRQLDKALASQAAALVVTPEFAPEVENALLSPEPYLSFVRIMHLFAAGPQTGQGVHDFAFVSPAARLDPSVTCHPFSYVGADAEIGKDTVLFPGCYVGDNCRIGERCILYPNVVLMDGTALGNDVVIHPGAVLGADGFGYIPSPEGILKVPQVGHVEVGHHVEIGALAAIDRATLDTTRIGHQTKIDNLVQIAHNVSLGNACLIVAQTGISGSCTVGDQVIMGGQVGLGDHVNVGDKAMLGAKAGFHKDVPPGARQSGYPAMDHKTFRRASVLTAKLPELSRRIKQLEQQVAELAAQLAPGEDNG
ncbi:MAG: UDP-3-O-(3-hydroxymyristoyl)glucosamine N-acyltransferase [Desulfovibrio sp.]|nr:MAG: UDP-3-O-(3-hydroxymyristoyl)glucosamine N-acyltransferase [Desulfovibrio sp.]